MSYCPARPDGQLEGRPEVFTKVQESDPKCGLVSVQTGEEEMSRVARRFSAISAPSVKGIGNKNDCDLEKGEAFGHGGKSRHLEDSLREARQNQRLIGEKKTRFREFQVFKKDDKVLN